MKDVQSKLRQYLPIFLVTFMSILSYIDIWREYKFGETFYHLIYEVIIATIATCWSSYLLINLKSAELNLVIARGSLAVKDEESKKWRLEYSKLLKGVTDSIDEQFNHWGLTPAEKEVGLLLLKGLSFKEISDIRQTSEKTTRQQATSIYQKANLPGRAELSAYFLGDFLVGSQNS